MPPKSSNVKSEHKNKIKLDLDKLKNGDVQKVKIDLYKIKINTLAKKVGLLSEGVNLYMYLPTSKRYYALNDRAINLLMGGDIDMSVAVGSEAVVNTPSDAEFRTIYAEGKM